MKRMEKSLLFVLVLMLAVGCTAHARQQTLSEKLIRLHIVAEDDSDRAQAQKLLVRDAVLQALEDLSADSAEDARRQLESRLSELEQTAAKTLRAAGSDSRVTATLEQERFPTREYETFALPAGEYTALRVIIGDGRGQNWWCVAFPPLCVQAAAAVERSDLTQQDWALISLDDGFELRFLVVDWTEKLLSFFHRP